MKKCKIGIILLIMVAGCSDNDLADYYLLGSLRVLALKASAPEVSAGDTVTITPLISDLNGVGRTLTYTATACVDPGTAKGANPSCAADTSAVSSTGSFTLAASKYTGTAPSISVSVPSTVLSGYTEIEQYNGVPYLFIYTVSGGTGTVSSYRRIIVSTQTNKNANPTLTGIRLTSDTSSLTALTSLPSSETELTPMIGTGAESYTLKNAQGVLETLSETITVTWFIAQGSMKYSRTDGTTSNTYTPSSSVDSSKAEFMVAVIHDSRGGEDYLGLPSL